MGAACQKPTAMYRHFAADGALLYIGISHSPTQRSGQHKQKAAWYYEVTSTSVQWFASRREAEAAEKAAIIAERPPHNVVWNRAAKKPGRRLRRMPQWLTDRLEDFAHMHAPEYSSRLDKIDRDFGAALEYTERGHRFWLRLTDQEFADAADSVLAFQYECAKDSYSYPMTDEEEAEVLQDLLSASAVADEFMEKWEVNRSKLDGRRLRRGDETFLLAAA